MGSLFTNIINTIKRFNDAIMHYINNYNKGKTMGINNDEAIKDMAKDVKDVKAEDKVEAKVKESTPVEVQKTNVQKPKSEAVNIKEAVASQIAGSSSRVKDIVVNNMVQSTISKRADILTKALDTLGAAKGELNKMKPDVVAYNDAGVVASSNWTKDALEKKKKAIERTVKLSKLIDAALSDKATGDDWGKLGNLK